MLLGYQREILESLARLRLAQDRIQTVGDASGLSQGRSGGKADVEAAILTPRTLTDTLNNENIEYIAVKKLRLDEDSGDDRALAVSPGNQIARYPLLNRTCTFRPVICA